MSDVSRRRPWLAVLLAVLISGLGHAYLRRWGRAFGWYVAITAVLVLFVPDAAIDQLFAREVPPIADIAPALVVIAASIIDAYVVAVQNNREYERQQRAKTVGAGVSGHDGRKNGFDGVGPKPGTESAFTDGTDSVGSDNSAGPDGLAASSPDSAADPTAPTPTVDCPHCGRETDAEIDFCHWCTEPLGSSADGDAAE